MNNQEETQVKSEFSNSVETTVLSRKSVLDILNLEKARLISMSLSYKSPIDNDKVYDNPRYVGLLDTVKGVNPIILKYTLYSEYLHKLSKYVYNEIGFISRKIESSEVLDDKLVSKETLLHTIDSERYSMNLIRDEIYDTDNKVYFCMRLLSVLERLVYLYPESLEFVYNLLTSKSESDNK